MTPLRQRLLFTDDVTGRIDPRRRNTASLLVRWAQSDGPAASCVRAQLEAAAALTPEAQRERLLRPITARSSPDAQVRDATGVLLLAAALSGTGWAVEYEPEIDGLTPDLRITKNECTFVVEVRRVTGKLASVRQNDAFDRLQDAVLELPLTETPVFIESASVAGGASLKRFVKELQGIVTTANTGVHHIAYEGVSVTVRKREPLGMAFPVIIGGMTRIAFGSEAPAVRDAVHKKLASYKYPLIVALDLVELSDAFRTAREALVGTEIFRVPVSNGPLVDNEKPSIDRLLDGVTQGGDRDAVRARERLVAIVPFQWGHATEGRLSLQAQLLANPHSSTTHDFAEFAPLPRLVVTGENDGVKSMQYIVGTGSTLHDFSTPPNWSFRPPT